MYPPACAAHSSTCVGHPGEGGGKEVVQQRDLSHARSETHTNTKCTRKHFLSHTKKRKMSSSSVLSWGCAEYAGSAADVAPSHTLPLTALTGAAVSLACGSTHTVAITGRATICVWGDNTAGQLGLGSTQSIAAPTEVDLAGLIGSRVLAGVSCGSRHTVLWCTDGAVVTMGANFNAQLGYDYSQDDYKQNQVCLVVNGDAK